MKLESKRLIITTFDLSMAEDVHLNSLDEDNRKFVPDEVFETIEDAYRLCKKTDMIKTVNLGGAKVADDKRQISKAVFVSEKDCEMLREMNAAGIKLEVQMLPDDEALDAMSLI